MTDNTDDHKDIDPLLIRKWKHAFNTFFDVNRNGILELDDFQMLIEVIKDMRGEKSKEYQTAQIELNEIWDGLVKETHCEQPDKISLSNWIAMWTRALTGSHPQWQQHYLDYMFKLFDASGDKYIDLAEYIEVLDRFDIGRTEAVNCFDKFAKVNESQLLTIDYDRFCGLWNEYFHSTDLNAPGNYLLGYL